jgi:hypothetical protein
MARLEIGPHGRFRAKRRPAPTLIPGLRRCCSQEGGHLGRAFGVALQPVQNSEGINGGLTLVL